MDEPGFDTDFLSASRVAIWGLGLMGGSLALGLKGKCASLVGIDSDPAVVQLAIERRIVDDSFTVNEVIQDSQKALAGVNVFVLAAPVGAILNLMQDLPGLFAGQAVVIDLGSTKAQIVKAMAGLPERFDPVGGHPMCGKEKSSIFEAEAEIYRNAPFALVSLERSSTHGRALAEQLARTVGACPLWIGADQHDEWVAATSHLPFLVASAMVRATPMEVAPLVGPGFRSTARLAGSSPRMMADIFATNASNIRAALQALKAQILTSEELLDQGDFEALAALFQQTSDKYRSLCGGEKKLS